MIKNGWKMDKDFLGEGETLSKSIEVRRFRMRKDGFGMEKLFFFICVFGAR